MAQTVSWQAMPVPQYTDSTYRQPAIARIHSGAPRNFRSSEVSDQRPGGGGGGSIKLLLKLVQCGEGTIFHTHRIHPLRTDYYYDGRRLRPKKLSPPQRVKVMRSVDIGQMDKKAPEPRWRRNDKHGGGQNGQHALRRT
eukprot:767351-Hanusia_phi.AAC.1